MENRIFGVGSVDDMTLDDYKAIYEAIVSLSCDADGYGLYDHITEEDIEKCKWIASICEVLDDVPVRRVKHIFEHKKIRFDCDSFLEERLYAE